MDNIIEIMKPHRDKIMKFFSIFAELKDLIDEVLGEEDCWDRLEVSEDEDPKEYRGELRESVFILMSKIPIIKNIIYELNLPSSISEVK